MVTTLSNVVDLRDRHGLIIAPLPFGQHELRIRVNQPVIAPQCFSFTNLALELLPECEDVDSDHVQDVYQYRTRMDEKTGDVTVIHPAWDNETLCRSTQRRRRGRRRRDHLHVHEDHYHKTPFKKAAPTADSRRGRLHSHPHHSLV